MALDKRNALHISARSGTLKVTKFLVEQYQFNMFDSSNIHERNAFLCSASGGKVDQMKYFLRKNPNLAKTSTSDKFNALHLSAKFGTLQGTKFLVEILNFDMFDFNRFGRNSFLCAASKGKLDQVKYFIKQDSAIKYSKDKDNWNALTLSVAFGTLEVTKFLVEQLDFEMCCTLELAKKYKKPDQIKYLESKKITECSVSNITKSDSIKDIIEQRPTISFDALNEKKFLDSIDTEPVNDNTIIERVLSKDTESEVFYDNSEQSETMTFDDSNELLNRQNKISLFNDRSEVLDTIVPICDSDDQSTGCFVIVCVRC